jgi:hypothetical protein
MRGSNEIRLVIANGQYGGCGAELQVRINGNLIKSLGRKIEIPIERAPANATCADELIPLELK